MNLTNEFNAAANPGGTENGVPLEPAPNGPRPLSPAFASAAVSDKQSQDAVTQPHAAARTDVETKQTELQMLEAGRATPGPRLNFNPPTGLKKAVDSDIERLREARAIALKAYLQFHHREPEHAPQHDEGEDLEFDI